MSRFSVIIPTYDDNARLAALLSQLQSLPHRPYEVLVVDGAKDEECKKVCQEQGAYWLAGEPCRGSQLLAGGAMSQGDALWFLHASARLPFDPIMAMGSALERGAIGGYFRFCFDAPRAWPALVLERAIALRCRFGIPYGDQGLFMTRQAYFEAGGHAPWPLFEEVVLVRGLRRVGRFLPLREPLFVDSRRWRRDGWWRRTWLNRGLALACALGASPHKLAARYRSKTN